MSITSPPKVATNELMDALVLLSEPVKFKERIKEYAATIKKINAASRKYDDAVKIAATVERAEAFARERRDSIDKLEAKRNEIDKIRQAKLAAQEMSITRREGAHQTVVKEHEEANTATRNDATKLNRSLMQREATLERGNKQLAQDNASLKTAQDALSERRARLADAIKN